MRKFNKQAVAWLVLAGLIQSSTGISALAEVIPAEPHAIVQEAAVDYSADVLPQAADVAAAAETEDDFANLPVADEAEPVPAVTAEESDVTGSLDEATGVLTITGTGAVTSTAAAQWSAKRDSVKSVVIGEGITEIGANVFQNYTYLTRVTFPKTLTVIGDLAFSGCTKLASVSVPAVETIGAEAFRGCTSLTSAAIADGVEVISNYCFAGCTSLKTVAIPSDSLTDIGDYAFSSCNVLERVNFITSGGVKENTKNILEIPSGVKTIGDFAFQGCSIFESLIISETVEYIGGSVFSSCNSLKEVSITDGEAPLVIDAVAFKNLDSLTTVTLNRVTILGEGVFENTGIARISLPGTLTTIMKNCFYGSKLEELTFIPSKVTIGESAFSYCTSLKTVDMRVDSETNSGVTEIGKNAFANCTALKAITIPASETKMGDTAFQNCTSLKTVTIDNGAKAIGKQAFNNCPITEIEVPASVTTMINAFAMHTTLEKATLGCATVSNSAFKACANLGSVVLNKGVEKLDVYSFQACTSLNTLVMPDSLTTLANYSLAGCTALTDVTMPKVTTINTNVFDGDTSLTGINGKNEIKLPDTIVTLGTSAFKNCSALNNVTMPSNVRIFSKNVFDSCTSLSKITYPEDINTVDDRAFYKCTSLESFKMPASAVTVGTSAFEGCTALKTVDMKGSTGLVTIRAAAFKDCDVLNDVVIPSGVTILNDNLFNGCDSLETITVESAVGATPTLTSIGASTFKDCALLKGFDIPTTVQKIGNYAFQNCAALDIAIPANSYEKITWGTYVFAGCKNLGKTYDVVVPQYLTKIGSGLFQNCENLKVTQNFIPSGVTEIGADAFSGCTSTAFTAINIPSNVTLIGNNAFKGCTNIQTVDLFTRVITKIGDYAFADCKNIKVFVVPTSVTTLGKGVFSGCTSLRSATLSGTKIVAIPEQAFMNCSALTTIDIPDGYFNTSGVHTPFTQIGKNAFAGCRSLGSNSTGDFKTIVIPTTTTKIDESAFDGCASLTYMVVPASVITLGKNAFANCTNLEIAIILSNPLLTTTFEGDTKVKLFTYSTSSNVIKYAKENNLPYELIAGSNGTYIAVLKHPENWTSAKVGDTAVFTVRAVSDGALHYTWYAKKQGESEFTSTGVTGDTLSVSVTAETEGMAVYCMITETKNEADTDIINSTNTEIAYITSMTAPKIASVSKMGVITWNKISGADEYHVYRADSEGGAKTELTVITDIDVTSYTDSTAVDGRTYYYYVAAVNKTSGISIMSDPKSVTINNVPTVTTITSAEPGDCKVTLTWEKLAKATKYSVYLYANGQYTCLTTEVTGTTYTATGLTNGTKYGFKVKAFINNEWAEASEMVYATPVSSVPANITATAGDTTVTLTWDKIYGAEKYAVYSYLNGVYTTETTTAATNSYTVTGLKNGTKYGFKVKSYVDGKWSAASELVYATPVSSVPTNLKAAAGNSTVTLTWNKVSGATKYMVYSYLNGAYTTVTDSATDNTYTVTGLTNGVKYGFKVKAYVNGKWSAASSLVYATPVGNIIPENLRIANGDGKVQVTWDKVAGATKYAVYSYLDGVYTTETTSVTTNTYTVSGLTNGTKYGFKVKAYVGGKWSAASAIIYARPSASTAPGAIKAIAGNNSAEVKWSGVIGATRYAVYKYENGVYTCINSNITSTSYTVTGLTNGTKYGFKVKAYVDGKWSAASVIAYATPSAS